jgi:hypothetical protein
VVKIDKDPLEADRTGAGRLTGQERTRLVIRVLRGEIGVDQAARLTAVRPEDVQTWVDQFLAQAEASATAEVTGAEDDGRDEEAPGTATSSVGIWVCAATRDSLLPCLFMQAACPARFPLEGTARWAGESAQPHALQKLGDLALLYGRCDSRDRGGPSLHLLATKVVATAPFEEHTDLVDWELPAAIAGIVLLIDRAQGGYPPSAFATRWGRSLRMRGDRTATWAMRQRLPLVVAGVGFSPAECAGGGLQRRYGLGADIVCVAGRAPVRSRPQSSGPPGEAPSGWGRSLAGLLSAGELAFDAHFAGRILATLAGEIADRTEV